MSQLESQLEMSGEVAIAEQSAKASAKTSAQSLVEQYFDSFCQQRFDQCAALFEPTGELHPPMDAPVVGRADILAYLAQKASEMTATAQQWDMQPTAEGNWEIEVSGHVQAKVFQVNVAWHFIVTPANEIAYLRIKLLASLVELVNFPAAVRAANSSG
jgi:hypothetical protein